MNAPDFLLDTNFIIGLIQGQAETLDRVSGLGQTFEGAFSCSSISRMEALGYPKIRESEELLLNRFFSDIQVLPLTREIENLAIRIRRNGLLKLLDAMIAATALSHGLRLLTLDKRLEDAFERFRATGS